VFIWRYAWILELFIYQGAFSISLKGFDWKRWSMNVFFGCHRQWRHYTWMLIRMHQLVGILYHVVHDRTTWRKMTHTWTTASHQLVHKNYNVWSICFTVSTLLDACIWDE
jgi:hypothetical protein